ncbi:WecB/TagA/CpsF family glycosyltransferase [Acuticoccus kandeliae]|uniref:WecB/TagA/CpsF family glycosyltransferase n=1 Tax=Acuticoccus kandeliae TaxID=2073160 RepID=UPI00130059BC|nr:WecB/TagA/CpsF family glycosyltransferase [Acuticoccus kandeliae]
MTDPTPTGPVSVPPAPPLPDFPEARVFGITVAVATPEAVIERIIAWAGGPPARTVITANLDHVMKLRDNAEFQRVYSEADLVTADGMPLVWVARHDGVPLKERVTGSDMIAPLMKAAADAGRSVFLFGSTIERLERARDYLVGENPGLEIRGVYAPPFGFEKDATLHDELVDLLRKAAPDLILVALGAPKQEIWANKMARAVPHGVFLGIGAGLDFLSEEVRRAPTWMRRTGLEWVYRAASEPKRLGGRYLGIVANLPALYSMHRRDRKAWLAARDEAAE